MYNNYIKQNAAAGSVSPVLKLSKKSRKTHLPDLDKYNNIATENGFLTK